MIRDGNPKRFLPPALLVLMLSCGAAAAGTEHAGGLGPYLLFHASCALLAVAAFLPPVFHGFSALAIFLLLGFWLKFVITALGGHALIEPIGDFVGAPEEWDRALTFAAAGLAGVALAKVSWWAVSSREPEGRLIPVPAWYLAGYRYVWAATILVILAGNLANWFFRFYVVGVHERVVLPFHLNVPVVWWLTFASGIWLATLLHWESRRQPQGASVRLLLVPMAEALLTTVVMLSRGFYLMKVAPYALALLRGANRRRFGVRLPSAIVLAFVASLGFAVSLVGVFWLRIVTYPHRLLPVEAMVESDASTPADATSEGERYTRRRNRSEGQRTARRGSAPVPAPSQSLVPTRAELDATFQELTRMFVGRWIGLEGVLAVSVVPDLGTKLLIEGVKEDPGAGNAALYQVLSGSTYKPQPGFTFMTLPGAVAVTAYSGSHLLVLLGMAGLTLIVLITEAAYRRVFQNDLLCAVVGVAMANAVVQMNFPYLAAVFFVELWGSLVILWAVSVIRGRTAGAPLAEATMSRP